MNLSMYFSSLSFGNNLITPMDSTVKAGIGFGVTVSNVAKKGEFTN